MQGYVLGGFIQIRVQMERIMTFSLVDVDSQRLKQVPCVSWKILKLIWVKTSQMVVIYCTFAFSLE